jgi:hypothetical protein
MTSVGISCVDEVEQVADARIFDLLLEQRRRIAPETLAVLQGVAEILGERTLAGAEKARYPDADAFMGIGGSLGDGLEQLVVLITNAVGAMYSVISA